MSKIVIEVYGGRFHCESCGATWAGSWHGPKKDITCLVCKKLLYPEKVTNVH